jgi:Bax protein
MKQFFSRKHKVKHALFWSVASIFLCGALLYPIFFIEGETPPLPVIEVSRKPVPDFSTYTSVVAKKQAFFEYLKPEIIRQNALILQERSWLLAMQYEATKSPDGLSEFELEKLEELADEYGVKVRQWNAKSIDRLLIKVDIIPTALILVQGANESAWGTSRFAKDGYNFFGLWCFKKGCGFVPRFRDEDAAHEVAKFSNLQQGVKTYINNLNRHPAYNELRSIRAQLRRSHQPIEAAALAEGLLKYSERGQAYVDEIIAMLRINQRYL